MGEVTESPELQDPERPEYNRALKRCVSLTIHCPVGDCLQSS